MSAILIEGSACAYSRNCVLGGRIWLPSEACRLQLPRMGVTCRPVRLQVYGMHFADANGRPYLSSGGRVSKGAPILVGCTDEIEELRPKSPPPGGDRN